jgi:hypothetical protein
MSQAQSVTASFVSRDILSFGVFLPSVLGNQITAQLTIQPGNFSQHITVGQYTNSLEFPDGTTVTITLFPDQPGLSLTWGGACSGTTGNTCAITMNSNQSFSVAAS